jgi:TPR repeat protein
MLARIVFIAILFQAAGAFAQTPLKVASPPAVLNDPKVQACRMLGAPRVNPKAPRGSPMVEVQAALLNIDPVIEALSLCRDALALYPTEPSVITAENTASEVFNTILFGIDRPDDNDELFRFALRNEAEATKMPMMRPMYYFFLGSSYEYGIGTPLDLGQAMKFYLMASEGAAPGAAIAKQKAASLLQKAQAIAPK